MALEFSVVTYGNGDILREVFNAIAATMNSDSVYSTLIHLAIGLAGVWTMLDLIHKRNLTVLVRWFALYYLAFYVVFFPKATVNIIDRVAQGKVYTVDNVPLGLAALASYTSVIGDSLTQLTEQNFSLPDDLRYGQTGMVMASSLVTAASTFQITDPVFENNLQDFINQCVFYDLLLNKYSAQDLLTTSNIWQFVTQNASPARAFMYNNTVVTCKDGVASLAHDWQTAIEQAEERYGARLFPNQANAKTQLLQYLPISYNFLTNLSEDASSLMQQNMMANALQNGILGWGARSKAPAALESYAFNKSQQQNRIGNRTIGDMAAYWLPLLKNIFEGILYGSFVFVFVMLLFPFGLVVLRNYAYSLLWVQLWAPLYAIINLFVNFYAQYHSLGATILSGGSNALTLSTLSGLAQVNADMSGLAGYLSLSVPLLVTGIVAGMHRVLAHAAQYVGGSLQSSSTSSAGEAASGNFSLANTHFSTHQAHNTSANHFDTTARTFSGMITSQMPGGSTLSMAADGSAIMNNQSAISNLGTTIKLASSIRATAMQQADSSYSAALSHQQAYSDAMSEAERGVLELSLQQGISQSHGQSFVTSNSASATQALSQVVQQSNRVTDGKSNSDTASRGHTTTIGAQASVGAGLPGVSPVQASISASGGISESWAGTHAEQKSHSTSQELSHNASYSQNVDNVMRAVSEGSYRASTEQGERLLHNISLSLERAHQEQVSANSQFQQAQTYREVASVAEENMTTIDSNATQEFMGQLQHSGQSMRAIEQTMVNHPQQAQAMADQFVQTKTQEYLAHFHQQEASTPAKVAQEFKENNQSLSVEKQHNNPIAAYQSNQEKITEKADKSGLASNISTDKISAGNTMTHPVNTVSEKAVNKK
ncbi:MAG TPA: conjugal transfer protein TraG N-terminal domain-containing protein [Gammaproteobacteria bacterium]|nr:conjugal transfer protein TraG N-terminal domain-containing protein [Gammaproteobacteria bacterium]